MRTESLLAKASSLARPSSTIVRLLQLAAVPELEIEQVIGLIGRDAILSARLIALANASHPGITDPICSVRQAVLRLGYPEIHRLVLALEFGSKLGVELAGYNMAAGTLWRHSMSTAVLTTHVLSLTGESPTAAAAAYTAALLHDIGKLVTAGRFDEKAKVKLRQLVGTQGKTMLEAERSILGVDHAEAGAQLLESWEVPDRIVAPVRYHHEPSQAGTGRLPAGIHVANAIAHLSGASPGLLSFAFTVDEGALTALGFEARDVEWLTFLGIEVAEGVARDETLLRSTGRPAEQVRVQAGRFDR